MPETESHEYEQKAVIGAVESETIVGAKDCRRVCVIILGCDDVNLDHISTSAFFVALTRARAHRSR